MNGNLYSGRIEPSALRKWQAEAELADRGTAERNDPTSGSNLTVSPFRIPVFCSACESARCAQENPFPFCRLIDGGFRLSSKIATLRRHGSARSRKGSSTSWDIRSGGCIPQRPAKPAWATGRQRRASSAWSKIPRADRPSAQLARDHRARRHVKPRASRVGQLLQCRHHQQSLSRARQLHGCAVAPVAAIQAQGQAT